MQTDEMEVPINNNIINNCNKQRPVEKGKDVFNNQPKESEVFPIEAQPRTIGNGSVE